MRKKIFIKMFVFLVCVSVVVLSAVFVKQSHSFANEIKKVQTETLNISKEELELSKLMDNIGKELKKENLQFTLQHGELNNKPVEFTVKFPVEQKVDKALKDKIQSIASSVIKKNKFNPEQIKINVINVLSETQDFKSQIDDLGGQIGLKLIENNYKAFAIEPNALSEKEAKIHIKLPVENLDESTKLKIQKIATEVIQEHNFDLSKFTINVQGYLEGQTY
ncbi:MULTISPECIES: hypothetical protein [Lysinibacillus]|uniref:Uncharacterized protein n=3 Tax=Lysinibacillus TaxID=400634 RepID=A0AAJ5UVV8_9BACI|nr:MULTISPECIES: hypothetical protein [Lysinibacillus]MEA0566227.1 hypothetical protein [Lysinibacillus irui]WDV09369.1 hypothetical protein OU989_22900 [Lysinibacillus irui]